MAEQLDSIEQQDYPSERVHVLIRDDGSTDRTSLIANIYVSKHSNWQYISSANRGVPECFFELLRQADRNCDYFAFCDQDDVWLSYKISRAIERLHKTPANRPALYCANYNLVDSHLELITSERRHKSPSFSNAVIENIAAGCSIVFNRALLEIMSISTPQHCVMHDWWAYLCASAFGFVEFDQDPVLLYRQHNHNSVGVVTGTLSRITCRIQTLLTGRHRKARRLQCADFYKLYSAQLSEKQRAMLKTIACYSLSDRIRGVTALWYKKQSPLDTFLLNLCILIGLV